MKTSLVSPTKRTKPVEPVTFPALYQSVGNGNIVVLATGPRAGVVIHSAAPCYPVGMQYADTSSLWETATAFTRVTEPLTIKFQP